MKLRSHGTSIFVLATILAGCGSGDSEKTAQKNTAVDDAYKVCTAMEGTGLTTQCSVHGWDRTIDITIDTNGSEARKICQGAVEAMSKKTRSFAGNWKLQIFSPYSGDRPIAVCTLL